MVLFETQNQFIVFLIIVLIGFICGFIFDANKYINFLCNKNKIVQIILDFLSVLMCAFVFFISCLHLNFGEFRFYILLGFIVGVLIQRTTLGIVIAKICKLCYDKLKVVINKLFKTKEKHENNAKG